MPVVPAGALISINFDARHNGQQLLLTTHWTVEYTGGAADEDLFEFYDGVSGAVNDIAGMGPALLLCYSEEVVECRHFIQMIDPIRYIRNVYSTGMGEGQVAEASFPPNVAHVITVRTDVAGRDQRGNKHMGGVPLSFSEEGHVTGTGLTAYETFKAHFITPMEYAPAVGAVILHPVIFRVSDPTNSPVITNAIVQNTTRVERRRTVGLGS